MVLPGKPGTGDESDEEIYISATRSQFYAASAQPTLLPTCRLKYSSAALTPSIKRSRHPS